MSQPCLSAPSRDAVDTFFMLGLIVSDHFVHVVCSTVSLGSLLRRTGSSYVDLIEGHVDLLTKLLFFSEWQKASDLEHFSVPLSPQSCALMFRQCTKFTLVVQKKTTVIGLRSTDKWS